MHVVAALIWDDGRLLSVCRGYGKLKGFWEFPGGKVEEGESLKSALVREIYEELAAEISIEKHLLTHHHITNDVQLKIDCFLCTLQSSFSLLEHSSYAWLSNDDFLSINWLEADVNILKKILSEDLIDFN